MTVSWSQPILTVDGLLESTVHPAPEGLSIDVSRGEAAVADDFLVPTLPVDFHCHGIGPYDFTDVASLNLRDIDQRLEAASIDCVLTCYLPFDRQHAFEERLLEYEELRAKAELRRIKGFAVEGPLLGSVGGTPTNSVWAPSRQTWERLASYGARGLHYVVLSPDAALTAATIPRPDGDALLDTAEIATILASNGVSPALGHFNKGDPAASAASVSRILAAVESHPGPTSWVITDHLFNDMPTRIRYAWRGPREYQCRQVQPGIAWNMDNAAELLGPVPATLIKAAASGRLLLCLNFDDEHVDREIARHVVKQVGAEHIIAITDRIEGTCLGGRELSRRDGSTLLYQGSGVVAVGSTNLQSEMEIMRSTGLSTEDIWRMMAINPNRALLPSKSLRSTPTSGTWSSVSRSDWERCEVIRVCAAAGLS